MGRWIGWLMLGLLNTLPVYAGRVEDSVSNVSFVPPPYFQTSFGAKGTTYHYILTPPDKHVVIFTGALLDRKFATVRPLNASEIKSFCGRSQVLFPKLQLTLGVNKRYLMDGRNGVECRFKTATGRVIHWVGIPLAGQLVYFYGDWPKPPTDLELETYRFFLGSVQIF